MKAELILGYGQAVYDIVGRLKGRRAIEAMKYHKELGESLEKLVAERNELIKEHGDGTGIKPSDPGWPDFVAAIKELGGAVVELPTFTITEEDAEKLELTTNELQTLSLVGLWT